MSIKILKIKRFLTLKTKSASYLFMSDAFNLAIEEIKKRIAEKESEISPLRITLNELCKLAGLPEEFPGLAASGISGKATKTSLTWKPDQFYGRPLATCVAEYFEARDKMGLERPAMVDQVYEALLQGGFKFEGSTGSEANTKRAIKISLTKNTAQFVKLPDDSFSLKKWYNVRSPRKANGLKNEASEEVESPVEEAEENGEGFTSTDSISQ
jgi:hypothetical protein